MTFRLTSSGASGINMLSGSERDQAAIKTLVTGGGVSVVDGTDSVTLAATSSPLRMPEDVVVLEGDSLMLQMSTTRLPNLVDRTSISNLATGGNTISDITSQAATTDGYLNASGTNRMFLMIGTNDLLTAGARTGSAVHEELVTYCQARQAAGWLVSVLTLPVQGGLANTTEINNYNELIQENWTSYADELIDLARDPRFQDSTDTIYFNGDEVHLTTLGYNIMGYHMDQPYASPIQNAYRTLENFGGDLEVTSIEGKANNNTRIEFTSNYMDHYYNNAFILRVGNGEVTVNPGGVTYDFAVYGDDATKTLWVDTSASSGQGLIIVDVPTSDPTVAGALWSNGGVLTVSAG